MTQRHNPLRATFVGAALLLSGLATGPVQAQVSAMDYDANPACEAFQRFGNGGWTAVAPSTMQIDNGMVFSFRPGQSMGPGSTINGVAVPIILDRHCGNM